MEAAKPTSRQLARRRREPRGHWQEDLLPSRKPDHRVTIAVVRSPPGGGRSWITAVKAQPSHSMRPAKAFVPSSSYTVNGQKPSQPSQRSRPAETVSVVPAKNRSSRQHHHQPGSGTWWKAMPVKAKVDSHWFKPHHRHRSAHNVLPGPEPRPNPGARRNKTNKSLAAAHEQLELMLSRIERAKEFLPPPPAIATPTTSRRRSVPMVSMRSGAKFVDKVAKRVSRHMAQPPPAPPGSPMNSARGDSASREESELEHHLAAVPLAHNPQRLMPAKRDALLELLQQREQHDRGILDMVRSGKGGDQSATDTRRMILQKLPLSLNESPYSGRDWKASGSGSGFLKERQPLHQIPQTEGQVLASRTMASEQGDGKQALVMHMEDKIRQLNERQEQAMRERAELEQNKQLVTLCREMRRERENRKKLVEIKKQQQRNREISQPQSTTIHLKDPLTPASSPIPVPLDPWKQLLQERDRFLGQCQRSYFYNNSRSPAPWKTYARVASKLSYQLMDILNAKFKQPMD